MQLSMRRVLVFLLAVLLPLQFTWGAVTSYCEHETGAASQHFGHHQHVHKGDKLVDADGKPGLDNDCWTCHSAATAAITCAGGKLPVVVAARVQFTDDGARHVSPAPKAPERPQWPRLA